MVLCPGCTGHRWLHRDGRLLGLLTNLPRGMTD
jgi:hypothetical protein